MSLTEPNLLCNMCLCIGFRDFSFVLFILLGVFINLAMVISIIAEPKQRERRLGCARTYMNKVIMLDKFFMNNKEDEQFLLKRISHMTEQHRS